MQAWLAWRQRYGPLHLQPQLERAAALVAYTTSCTVARPSGSKAPRYEDFLPQRQAASSEAITLEEAMKEWR